MMPMEAFYYRTLLVYALVNIYLFWHFWLLARRRKLFLVTLPLFACMAFFPLVHLHLPEDGLLQAAAAHLAQAWLPVAFFCLPVFGIYDVFRILRGMAHRFFPNHSFRFLAYPYIVSAMLLLGAAVYSYGLIEARTLTVHHLEIATKKLPLETKRLRIVFASDLHISPHTGNTMLQRTVDAILAEKPDIILLGGDILDDSRQGTGKDKRELERLAAPLGVFGVLGNHDAFGDADRAAGFLRHAGITMLASELRKAGPLTLVGIEDPVAAQQMPQPRPELGGLLRQASPERYTILLDHRPFVRPETIGYFDFQLSGHSHGGQIPLLWPHVRSTYGVGAGLSQHAGEDGESLLFMTTGTGFSKLPIRLLTPPEIVVIDLVNRRQAQ